MDYMYVKHKVENFEKWYKVFKLHNEAQKEAGLHLLHLLREKESPETVVMLFRVDDVEKARQFTSSPESEEAGKESGVKGDGEIIYLKDHTDFNTEE